MQGRSQLAEFLSEIDPHLAIRVRREVFEEGWVDGFVVGTGPEFFALALLDDGMRPNGFSCMRYADLTELEAPSPRDGFLRQVLELRGLSVVGELPADLADLPALLRSAGNAFPLVTIHLEAEEADAYYVGHAPTVAGSEVSLRTIDPDGVWDEGTDTFDLAAITRVDFGGAYEEALWLVGEQGLED